jgi:chitinase
MNTRVDGKSIKAFRRELSVAALMAVLLVFGIGTASNAVTVSLRWGASTGATGYRVYYQPNSSAQPFGGTGASQGSAPVDVSNQTSATISGLDPANAYYFAVTAYNEAGESSYSNVVSVPELTSPTTSISYPANNASVSGTVALTASASDNVGVSRVEFYVNGALQGSDTSTPYTCSWNTASLAAGSYTLTARAYDAAGNVGQSGAVTVTVVNDTTAPTVSLTSPANGATVNGTVAVTASASDNVGVSRVEFFANGTLLSASNVAPYSYSWNTAAVSNGSYTLMARAHDAAGNVRDSSSVSVVVNNSSALYLKGDLNSDSRIDIADALLALRMAVGLVTPTTDAMLRGDVAPVSAIDGKITIQDVMTILSAASGRITL